MMDKLTAEGIEALHKRAVSAFMHGRYAEAQAVFEEVVRADPGHAVALLNVSACSLKLSDPEKALEYADRTLAISPQAARAHTYRGLALLDLLRHEEALPALWRGFEGAADDSLAACNLARAFAETNRFDDAVRWYSHALVLDPQNASANFGLAVVRLQLGDYERGLPAYEWRWRERGFDGSLPRYPQPRWIGQFSIEGKTILLNEEQGLGDTIQFARYALWLVSEYRARVVLQVRPSLRELFRCFEDRVQVIGDDDPKPDFDCHCQLMSLPLACGTTAEAIPAAHRYIAAPGERLQRWAGRLGPRQRPRIGIAWSGSTIHTNDRARSMRLAEFPIPNPDLFDVVSLQHEVREVDRELLSTLPIKQVGPEFGDLADTAAAVELLDLVITVDTSVAHLAAALGKPVWLLLPFSADWRWLPGREKTGWYPTMRIFWQRRVGDWRSVFDEVTGALAEAAGMK